MAELRFPNINFIILSGRLVEDGVVRYTPQGTAVCTVRFASDRNFKNAQGQWVKEPLFINLVLFRGIAERSAGRLRKGTPMIVEGMLRSRTYESREGQRRTVYEIVVRRLHILEKAGEETIYVPEEEEVVEDTAISADLPVIELGDEEEEEDLPF